jgi:hypothetical protein
MNNLIRAYFAGHLKKSQNRPSLPRNFSAIAGTKNLKLLPKLVLLHAFHDSIHLVAFWDLTTNYVTKFFDLTQ